MKSKTCEHGEHRPPRPFRIWGPTSLNLTWISRQSVTELEKVSTRITDVAKVQVTRLQLHPSSKLGAVEVFGKYSLPYSSDADTRGRSAAGYLAPSRAGLALGKTHLDHRD